MPKNPAVEKNGLIIGYVEVISWQFVRAEFIIEHILGPSKMKKKLVCHTGTSTFGQESGGRLFFSQKRKHPHCSLFAKGLLVNNIVN